MIWKLGSSRVVEQLPTITLEWQNSQGILQSYNAQIQAIKAKAQEKIKAVKSQEQVEIDNLNEVYVKAQAQALLGSSVEDFETIMEKSPDDLKEPIQDLYFPAALKQLANMWAAQRQERGEVIKAQQKLCAWFDPNSLHSVAPQKIEKEWIPKTRKALIAALATTGLLGVAGYAGYKDNHSTTTKPAQSTTQTTTIPQNPSSK